MEISFGDEKGLNRVIHFLERAKDRRYCDVKDEFGYVPPVSEVREKVQDVASAIKEKIKKEKEEGKKVSRKVAGGIDVAKYARRGPSNNRSGRIEGYFR